MHGGSSDSFEDLTEDEIQLIFTTYTALQRAQLREAFETVASMFKEGKNG